MTTVERLIRRARVKMQMMKDGRVYRPPTNEQFDMVVDNLGIRFSTTILSVFDESACIGVISTGETIDNVLI